MPHQRYEVVTTLLVNGARCLVKMYLFFSKCEFDIGKYYSVMMMLCFVWHCWKLPLPTISLFPLFPFIAVSLLNIPHFPFVRTLCCRVKHSFSPAIAMQQAHIPQLHLQTPQCWSWQLSAFLWSTHAAFSFASQTPLLLLLFFLQHTQLHTPISSSERRQARERLPSWPLAFQPCTLCGTAVQGYSHEFWLFIKHTV